jgi:hypothetical protein
MADDFVTHPEMLDLLDPVDLEVKIRSDGKVLWINVNGICRLRARVKNLELIDERNVKSEA